MAEATSRTTFFSLPTELRLQIASYVLQEQPIEDRFRKDGYWRCPQYWSTSNPNLSLLLVCRQFRKDFTRPAWEQTTFIVLGNATRVVKAQSDELLKQVRKLVIDFDNTKIVLWDMFPFNRECLHLDELDIIVDDMKSKKYTIEKLVNMFRCLQNVRKVRLIYTGDVPSPRDRSNRIIGAILKEDHYARYDAPYAPEIESTWWDWSWSSNNTCYTFVAQEPKPLTEEEDYMLFIKPRVDEIMQLEVCVQVFENISQLVSCYDLLFVLKCFILRRRRSRIDTFEDALSLFYLEDCCRCSQICAQFAQSTECMYTSHVMSAAGKVNLDCGMATFEMDVKPKKDSRCTIKFHHEIDPKTEEWSITWNVYGFNNH